MPTSTPAEMSGGLVHLDLMRNCVVCGTTMDLVLTTPNHPSCIMFAEPGDEDSFTNLIKSTLTDIITEHDRRSPRSVQVKIGPSEMGDLCDRKVAYRLANIPPCNEPDNWPAIVGTACHSWLEGAVTQSTRARSSSPRRPSTLAVVEGHF